ncbi:NRPS [Recurvomyces mirabilis]|uniref:NRPS n=1 Tax=Recurvomyces mirabilis TaxID=574656 RepID=A0AAE0TQI6_9PEZI|nr:NRPS [Recurvomyces mirabilis]KAK5159241.1 hypothetical protein LTS14_002383 [Recurvomyces mirabilis]
MANPPIGQDLESCVFPKLGSLSDVASVQHTPVRTTRRCGYLPEDVDLDSLYHLTFALLLKAYTRSSGITYGFIDAVASSEAREAATTIRFQLDESATVSENLQTVLQVTKASMDSATDRRNSLNVDESGAKPYNSVLYMTQHKPVADPPQCSTENPIVLQIVKGTDAHDQAAKVILFSRSDYCDIWSAQNVASTFEHILDEVSTGLHRPLCDMRLTSARDFEHIRAWNVTVPATVYSTLNERFEKVFRDCANKVAVHTSEGSLTYRQVDEISTLLASHLIDAGVKPNAVVPICMNKSRWTTCAMVAVWKAGGALTAMEPAQPDIRLHSIIEELNAQIMICDSAHASRFEGLGLQVFSDVESLATSVSEESHTRGWNNAWHLSDVAPDDLAYVVFTSGSTGRPKGILNTHRRLMTEHQWFRENMGFHMDARILQFASYAFVAGTADNYRTLLHGATLCVPSETERTSDLVAFINRSRSTRVLVTPSLLRTLDPSDIPSVQNLAVVGEPVSRDFEAPWSKGRRFVQIYGSTEGGTWLKETSNGVSQSAGLRPVSGDQWLVDPNNPDSLVPIGAMGEIVLESHETMVRYLNDPKKTGRAFLESPAWADKRNIDAGCRYLRLGDLGRYERDGSITIFGRADTQVKINGQRVDLQDIETNLRVLLPTGSEVVVDLVKPLDASDRPLLIAFCQSALMMMDFKHDTAGRRDMLAIVQHELSKTLPQYMVPKAFIIMEQLPRNFSQKIDRKKLRNDAENMGHNALVSHIPGTAPKADEATMTHQERSLAQSWATVLRLDTETIRAGDSFLALGGDSLAAIRLVPILRSSGLKLATVDILKTPILRDMARLATMQAPDIAEDEFANNIVLHEDTAVTLQATDFQEWAALVGAQNGGWIDHFIYDFLGDLHVDTLRRACQQLVTAHSILRSVFILHEKRVFMKVLADMEIMFDVHHTWLDRLESDTKDLCARKRTCPLGAPIVRFDLLTTSTLRHRLVIRLSHAQYDGFAAGSVGEHLRLLYLSQPLPRTLPYHEYARRIREPGLVQNAEKFWRNSLRESHMPKLVERMSGGPSFNNKLDGEIHCAIKLPSLQHQGINPAALVKTAWALVLSSLSQSTDVIFGDFISGRQIPMNGIETVFGPCINLTPVRVHLDANLTNLELLNRVQEYLFQAMPFESLGMRHIVDRCSEWAAGARYSSIVNFINFEPKPRSTSWDTHDEQKRLDVTYIYEEQQHDKTDLWLLCRGSSREADLASGASHFDLYFRYSKGVFADSAVDKIANLYCRSLRTIVTCLDVKISVPHVTTEERRRLVPILTA